MDVKWVKIPRLAAFQVPRYMRNWSNVHEPLKNIELILAKNLFLNFLGANFAVPKSGHQCEKQPALGLVYWITVQGLTRTLQIITLNIKT